MVALRIAALAVLTVATIAGAVTLTTLLLMAVPLVVVGELFERQPATIPVRVRNRR